MCGIHFKFLKLKELRYWSRKLLKLLNLMCGIAEHIKKKQVTQIKFTIKDALKHVVIHEFLNSFHCPLFPLAVQTRKKKAICSFFEKLD